MYYPDEKDFKDAMGAVAGEAQEQILCDWVSSNRKIIEDLSKYFDKDDMCTITEIIKKNSPGI